MLCCALLWFYIDWFSHIHPACFAGTNDGPSAGKATLMNMDKYFMWNHYERLHNHNKAKHNKTVCILIGIYCTSRYLIDEATRYFAILVPVAAQPTDLLIMSPWQPLLGLPWRRHQMETLSALLVLCAGNSPVTGEFPSQRPVTRSFGVFFDLRLNKRLSKQSRREWIETP